MLKTRPIRANFTTCKHTLTVTRNVTCGSGSMNKLTGSLYINDLIPVLINVLSMYFPGVSVVWWWSTVHIHQHFPPDYPASCA